LNILLSLSLITLEPAMAATYRWIDQNGKVQYGDVMPPSQAGQGHAELDKQGRVIKETKRSRLTAEELQRQQEATSRQALELRKQEEQRRRDMALLATYTNENEILLARNRAIELENLNIRGLQTRLDAAAAKLSLANTQLARSRGTGQTAPASYVQMRNEAQAELAQISEALRQRNQAIEDIQLRFEADTKRFKEMKASESKTPMR
jgi:chromosome segregation ATPase